MKLVKQTVLHFREGASDKVYEVDLCEVGADRFVVNFRYGRRGSALKEGSKTVSPVSRREAEAAFNDLISSKTKKGYREVTAGDLSATPPTPRTVPKPAPPKFDADARNRAVLNRLTDPQARRTPGIVDTIRTAIMGDDKKKGEWPLERAIWRAGELKIREAAPLLVDLLGSGNPMRDYAIAWALGRCGDGSTVSALGKLYGDRSAPDHVRRMACEALLKLSDDAIRAEFRSDMTEQLPPFLRESAKHGPPEDFKTALTEYLQNGTHLDFAVLDMLYLIDTPNVRPALLDILRTAPLKPNWFKSFRHIFKAAEYRRDAEVFGVLAYRFEKEKSVFTSTPGSWFSGQIYFEGNWIKAKNELKSAASRLAYSDKTRAYLRRRVWRTLRRLGELGDPDYVKMAVGLLLPFTDADARPVKETSIYNWRTNQTRKRRWDAFAPYFAFNHVLHGKSPRYEIKSGTLAWRCKGKYRPGEPEPPVREESFPKLWEQVPVGLLHLLSESACRPVHHFGVKVLRECTDFLPRLDTDAVVMLLGRPYDVTARFGFELAESRWNPERPDTELVLAVANCAFGEARVAAQGWINERREFFLRDSGFLAALASCFHADTRLFARNLLHSAVLSENVAKACVVKLMAHLLILESSQTEQARDVAETIFTVFGPYLRSIGFDVVHDLLAHPLEAVQELGGKILIHHDTPARDLPENLILTLFASEFESVRVLGGRLMAALPMEVLAERENILISLATHRLADLRHLVRPMLISFLGMQADFAHRIALRLLDFLGMKESHEGVHKTLVGILTHDLGTDWTRAVSRETALNLSKSRIPAAAEVAGFILASNGDWAAEFGTDDIVKFGTNEIRALRDACREYFKAVVPRIRGNRDETAKAVRLLDSKWDDVREFGFKTFREEFAAEDWTPEILVSLCDNVREDVRAFGRELVTRFFTEADGPEYLLKLSEHPSPDVQLFATNYLERFASGNAERIAELAPYFTAVLSLVNRGRTAKRRVLAFLETEAVKDKAVARLVAEIFERLSLTMSVEYKAAAIEILLKIKRTYPDVPMPLRVVSAAVR